MRSFPLDETIHLISQSDDLRRGEVCVHADYITDRIKETTSHPALQDLSLDFQEQHAVVSARVGRAGVHYRWTNSFALRGVDLNGQSKSLTFEPSSKLSVQPASFGAKAIRFAPKLVPADSILPGASLAIGMIGKVLIDALAERVVDGQIQKNLGDQGIEVGEEKWTYTFTAEALGNHPAFAKVKIPWIGRRALFGDVILARSVALEDRKIKLQLGLNPLIVQMAEKLMSTEITEELGQLTVAGPTSSGETNPTATKTEAKNPSADESDSASDSWLDQVSSTLQEGAKKAGMNRALNKAGASLSGSDFELSRLKNALTSGEKEGVSDAFDAGTPDAPVDSEWTDSLESMEVQPPDALTDGLEGSEFIEFAADALS